MPLPQNIENCSPSGKKITNLIAYMVLILISSLIPMDRDIEGLNFIIYLKPAIQNLLHVPMFAVLGILSLQTLDNFNITGLRKFISVAFVAIGFGIFNELVQLWVPGRYAGLLDMGLNVLGVFLGIMIYVLSARSRLGPIRRLICG